MDKRLLVIDNYDSFTFNLVQYLGELGADLTVIRNDRITVQEIREMGPDRIVISPGPGVPARAGISVELIRSLGPDIPILGVCLGHQAIGEAYGGEVIQAPTLMHGKTSMIHHEGKGLFVGLEQPFRAARYHSLVVDPETLPEELHLEAWTEDGIIMGIRHMDFPVFGVQFHPESIMTDCGKQLLRNFLCYRN
ncbi:MAG: aminodeoxychorismate/anthranilate synthase component II [Acidobacteriota bacterium]